MSLCMMMRSSRTEPPDLTSCVAKTTDDMIESLVCPPPPSDSALNEEAISSLIVPAPKWNKESVSPDGESTAPPSDRLVHYKIPGIFEKENKVPIPCPLNP